MLDDLGVEVEGGGLADGGVVPQGASNTHPINIIGSERLLIKIRFARGGKNDGRRILRDEDGCLSYCPKSSV